MGRLIICNTKHIWATDISEENTFVSKYGRQWVSWRTGRHYQLKQIATQAIGARPQVRVHVGKNPYAKIEWGK